MEDKGMEENKEKKSFKEWATGLFEKGKDKVVDGVHYVKDHGDEIIPAAITTVEALAVVAGIGYSCKKASEANRSVYDKVTGQYVVTKKKLTNEDKVQMAQDMREKDLTRTEALAYRGKLK